jgi:phosphohistidine phosphatase
MKLYCMRHCDALSSDIDPECSLTDQGIQDAHKVADYLQHQHIHIPHVMHSGVKRAVQTADIIAEVCGAEKVVESPQLLADLADVGPMVDMLESCGQSTLLVGHMPFMSKLVAALVMDISDNAQLITFPPGTMACVKRFEGNLWMIDWVLKPENLGIN